MTDPHDPPPETMPVAGASADGSAGASTSGGAAASGVAKTAAAPPAEPASTVKVAIRVRPLLPHDQAQGGSDVARCSSKSNSVTLGDGRQFNFDHVYV